MNRPFMNMMRPDEGDYQKRTREIILYSYYEKWSEEDDCEDIEDEGEAEEYGWNRHTNDGPPDGINHWYSGYRDQPELPKIKLDKISLQFLADLLPEGVELSDVKIRSSIDAS